MLDVGARPEAAAVASAAPAGLAQPALPARVAVVVASPSPAFRADWPTAIRGSGVPVRLPREEGTDGLMGRLVFGLPNDTPIIHRAVVDWSAMVDERAEWSRSRAWDTTPPWVRRLGAFNSNLTDPYER